MIKCTTGLYLSIQSQIRIRIRKKKSLHKVLVQNLPIIANANRRQFNESSPRWVGPCEQRQQLASSTWLQVYVENFWAQSASKWVQHKSSSLIAEWLATSRQFSVPSSFLHALPSMFSTVLSTNTNDTRERECWMASAASGRRPSEFSLSALDSAKHIRASSRVAAAQHVCQSLNNFFVYVRTRVCSFQPIYNIYWRDGDAEWRVLCGHRPRSLFRACLIAGGNGFCTTNIKQNNHIWT